MASPNDSKPLYECKVALAWTALHPYLDPDTGETRYRHGKVRQGEQFIWHGDPNVCPPHFTVIRAAKQKPGPKPKAKPKPVTPVAARESEAKVAIAPVE